MLSQVQDQKFILNSVHQIINYQFYSTPFISAEDLRLLSGFGILHPKVLKNIPSYLSSVNNSLKLELTTYIKSILKLLLL